MGLCHHQLQVGQHPTRSRSAASGRMSSATYRWGSPTATRRTTSTPAASQKATRGRWSGWWWQRTWARRRSNSGWLGWSRGCSHRRDVLGKYITFGLDIRYRKYDQMTSVVGVGGLWLVAQSYLHGTVNIVFWCGSFRFSTWAEVHTGTDTLAGQPPYQVTQGWEEVRPEGV